MMPSSSIFSAVIFAAMGSIAYLNSKTFLRSVSLATSQLMAGDGFSAFFSATKAPFPVFNSTIPLA